MEYSRNIFLLLTVIALVIVVSACTIQTAPPSNQSANPSQESADEVAAEAKGVAEGVAVEMAAEKVDEAVVEVSKAAESSLTVEQAMTLAGLQDGGPAPELTNDVWLNSDPLRLADLRGNVVIVEFWTYG